MNNYQIVGLMGVLVLLLQVILGIISHHTKRNKKLPKPVIIIVIGPYLAGKSKLVCKLCPLACTRLSSAAQSKKSFAIL